MNLVLIDSEEAAAEVILTGDRARHVREVLKPDIGQTIRIGVVDGPLGTGTVTRCDADAVQIRCTFEPTVPPEPPTDLLLALPRPKVLRRLWAQLAALGVRRIILTNAARVERNYFDTHVLAPECYRPLLIEGLQQARDTRVPIVTIHRQLKVLIEDDLDAMVGDARRLIADPGDRTSIADRVRGASGDRVLLAVGPEGGWNDFERDLLRAHGFAPVSMGARTLRTDTACIALLSLVHDALKAA